MIIFDKNDPVLANIAEMTEKRMKNKEDLTLKIDTSLGEFEGEIDGDVLLAGSHSQLNDIIGRRLRNPELKKGHFVSEKKVSGMYFAAHYNNYLAVAPLSEIFEYIDDLALWGMNIFKVWFDMHHYKNMEDGREFGERLKAMLAHARSIGVKICLAVLANEAFADSPEELRADWTCGHDGYVYPLNDHFHNEICPSKPGGMEKILEYRKEFLEFFSNVLPDYISFGAYDEGGCTCPDCAPWGANGYLRCCEKLIPLIKQYIPTAKVILSLWQFGTFTQNAIEFEGVVKAFDEGRFPEVEFLLSEPQYAQYAVYHDMRRPVIGFPEISMCSTLPWGGYGANPVPDMLDGLWEKYGDKLEGGFPYCEGFYEDINKVIMLRLYRDGQKPRETVKEYLSYEFGFKDELLCALTEAVCDMDTTLKRKYDSPFTRDDKGREIVKEGFKFTHRYEILNPEKVPYIEETFKRANEALSEEIRSTKRWQVLYLRAMIDGELYRNDFYRNEKVLEYFNKLIDLMYLHNCGVSTRPDIWNEENVNDLMA